MEKQMVEDAEKEGKLLPEGEIKLPMFNELQAKKRADAERKFAEERATLEKNLSDIENQIAEVQKALNQLDGVQPIKAFFQKKDTLSTKSDDKSKKRKNSEVENKEEEDEKEGGARGPGGKFVPFPEYDGKQEPYENKKAFTLFCKATRKEVKSTLSGAGRKNKVSIASRMSIELLKHDYITLVFLYVRKDHINSILKERWYALTDDEQDTWREWEVWDAKRYEYQMKIYYKEAESPSAATYASAVPAMSIPKKSIPKKRRL